MAEAFLHELLQMQNSVATKGERCDICLEEYGTLSRQKGTIEVAIRLPCNHLIGSACITIWLETNNTCPICRREFFPAQLRPYLEHGIMDGQENENEDDQQREIIEDYCARLALNMDTTAISELLVQKLTESPLLTEGHTHTCIVVVGIYMASHLAGEPRSPREIANATGVAANRIREAYDVISPERDQLADEGLHSLLEEILIDVNPLQWPAPGYELSDEQIENRYAQQMLGECCEYGCNELGLDAGVAEFATRIAREFFMAGLMNHLSAKDLAAAIIFMASHMTRNPLRARQIAEALRMTEFRVRVVYETAYAYQYRLAGQPWLVNIGRGSMDSVLGRLPSPFEPI